MHMNTEKHSHILNHEMTARLIAFEGRKSWSFILCFSSPLFPHCYFNFSCSYAELLLLLWSS